MRALSMLLLFGCASTASAPLPTPDAAAPDDASADASVVDAADASVDKAGPCASMFGAALTNAFGRLDGTILAVVPPAHPTCAQPNSTHLVLQVTTNGAAYRMVLDVFGNPPDPTVSLFELDAPLAGPAWSEGWHEAVALDYVSTLAVKSTSFVPHPKAELVAIVTNELVLGAHVSVFATSTGGTKADSAHLIHRNLTNADGAIVIRPESPSAHYLLFKFAEQIF
jgi:hypothetical protein